MLDPFRISFPPVAAIIEELDRKYQTILLKGQKNWAFTVY